MPLKWMTLFNGNSSIYAVIFFDESKPSSMRTEFLGIICWGLSSWTVNSPGISYEPESWEQF
jgi:hypothetical protein